jgi:hypothetical protein
MPTWDLFCRKAYGSAQDYKPWKNQFLYKVFLDFIVAPSVETEQKLVHSLSPKAISMVGETLGYKRIIYLTIIITPSYLYLLHQCKR